jgi:hypothetical protein
MKWGLIAIIMTGILWVPCHAADISQGPAPSLTDTYQISFGPTIYAYLGDPALYVPIKISVTQPTTHIYLVMLYDPSLLTPTLLAPNIFVQKFSYDLSTSGRIYLEIITDLPPPPDVAPIMGDTIFAWISFRVTSLDIGYDYLTHITYFEDPLTPGPDNFLVLNNFDIIANPPLELIPADILVVHPLYGDLNLNGYGFEIADAVLFMNFFMGYEHFNRHQYANSDCNRDQIQASISDLIYMLNVINGDTILSEPPDLEPPSDALFRPLVQSPEISKRLDNREHCDILVDSRQPLGGASFMFDFNSEEVSPEYVQSDSAAGYMQLYSSIQGNKLIVTIVNWNDAPATFRTGRLFSIVYSGRPSGGEPFQILSADFADNPGNHLNAEYHIDSQNPAPIKSAAPGSMSLGGYPNPFNNSISISLNLPSDGNYQLAIYDILGRKVKTLFDGPQFAGRQSIIWDGTDDRKSGVASGTYFMRLKGIGGSKSMKLNLLK